MGERNRATPSREEPRCSRKPGSRAGRQRRRRTQGHVAGGARFVAQHLARRTRRVLARAGRGHEVFETLVKQGEALEIEDARRRRRTPRRGGARRRQGQGEGSEGRRGRHVGQAGAGVRGARRARARRSSACTRKATSSGLTERVDALSEAVNELIKATGVKPKRRPAAPARRWNAWRRRGVAAARTASSARATRGRGPASKTARRPYAPSPRTLAPRKPGRRGRGKPAVRRGDAAGSLAVELVDLLDVVGHRLVLASCP